MRVTVLPVRDMESAEKPPAASSWPVCSIPAEGFDGMPSTSVELLRAPRRSAAPAPRGAGQSPPRSPAPASPSAAPAPSAGSGPGSPAPSASPMIEIMLTNGRVVRVPPGIARDELERILSVASAEGTGSGGR